MRAVYLFLLCVIIAAIAAPVQADEPPAESTTQLPLNLLVYHSDQTSERMELTATIKDAATVTLTVPFGKDIYLVELHPDDLAESVASLVPIKGTIFLMPWSFGPSIASEDAALDLTALPLHEEWRQLQLLDARGIPLKGLEIGIDFYPRPYSSTKFGRIPGMTHNSPISDSGLVEMPPLFVQVDPRI